jgi:hypothetical protein
MKFGIHILEGHSKIKMVRIALVMDLETHWSVIPSISNGNKDARRTGRKLLVGLGPMRCVHLNKIGIRGILWPAKLKLLLSLKQMQTLTLTVG